MKRQRERSKDTACDCLVCAEATGEWIKVLYADLRKPWCSTKKGDRP